MERLGLILVLLLVGLFAIFSGDLQLGGAEVPTWLVLEGPFARVFGVLMIGIAGWLVYREFRRDRRPRTKGAQATPGERRDVQPSPEQRFLRLTEDDRRFLGLLAEDLPDEEVANRLGMPGLDINMMALSLCGKLGVKSKAELIQQAREMGLLAPDTKDEIPSPEQQKVTIYERLSHADYNPLFDSSSVEGTQVEVIDVGKLNVPTGKIVVCDPLTYPDIPPFSQSIPPGRYPVRICVAKTEDFGERYAAAKLEIQPGIAQKWVLALKGGEELSDLKTDRESFGFPVGAGLGSFADQETSLAYLKFLDRFNREHRDGNVYDDLLAPEFKKNAKEPDNPGDIGDWLDFEVPGQDGLNVIMFHSGYGDGVYPAYWGIGENGEAVSLVIDFHILLLPDDDE